MEGVFGVDGEAAHFRGLHFCFGVLGAGDRACFCAIAVEGEGAQGGGCEGEFVPFEDYGGLGCVAEADLGGVGGGEGGRGWK